MKSFLNAAGSIKRLRNKFRMAMLKSQNLCDNSLAKNTFLNAASTGDLPVLKRLANELQVRGQTIADIKDTWDGRAALHFAVAGGRIQVCKYLVEEVKLDIDVRNGLGYTPLHLAILQGHFATSKYLLENGANPNAKTIMLSTPLHFAVENGPKEFLKLLLSKGAEINAMDGCGTPLQQAVTKGREDIVEFLLDNKADPNAVSFALLSPLLESVIAREFECMKLLLKGGADPNLCGAKAMTPLWHAASQGWTVAIECLLNAGADPNVTNNEGVTPVEIAAFNGSLQGVRTLFPVTKSIPSVPDWSMNGIIKHVYSKEAEEARKQKLKEHILLSKLKGKEAFNREDYLGAIKWYTEALYWEKDAATICERSLCWACLNEGGLALEEARLGIFVNPEWPEAYHRMGAALMLLKDFEKAADCFYKAWKIDSNKKEYDHAFREAVAARQNEFPHRANSVPLPPPDFKFE